MKTFRGVIEDGNAIVIGAVLDDGEVMLLPEERVHRSQLRTVAVTLATKYDVDPASFTLPEPTPAPEGNDSTPQGAD